MPVLSRTTPWRWLLAAVSAGLLIGASSVPILAAPPNVSVQPLFSDAVARDVSPTFRFLAAHAPARDPEDTGGEDSEREERAEEIEEVPANGFSGGDAQTEAPAASIPSTLANFEGISNQDNFNIFGGRVNPPDPVGDVGPNHYVEMVNLAVGIYSKSGTLLLGPVDIGALWADFAVEDCTDPSGDPVVVYDQLADRWILTQFTTRGLDPPFTAPFYNCIAVSTTGDPTGSYYRYAFRTQPDLEDGGFFFPDYPKYGVWTDSYVMTTRDFGFDDRYGISVYALEKNKMLNGQPARAVQFFLEDRNVPLKLIGDGLLPADIDGKQKPMTDTAIPVVGTQDNDWVYGAATDTLNIWDLRVKWRSTPIASLELNTQLAVTPFDSNFPCGALGARRLPPGARDHGPGPIPGRALLPAAPVLSIGLPKLQGTRGAGHDPVSGGQLPTRPACAGTRSGVMAPATTRSSSRAPLPRPMASIAGWAASRRTRRAAWPSATAWSTATNVFPGIRYTGRLPGDAAGQMTLGEGTVINGTGVQTTTNSRWGDYTSMNIDPVDDCTFWYVNEYYTAAGQASSTAGWQTRIASFKLPGC